MRRVLWIMVVTIITLSVFIALALIFFLRTVPGQNILTAWTQPLIERAVRESLGSDITFDAIRGRLPGEILLNNVTLTDADGRWAEIGSARLLWSPIYLLRSRIVIDDFTMRDATWHRGIVLPTRTSEESEDENPGGLPSIHIRRIALENIVLMPPVLGQRYDLSVTGAFAASRGTANGQLTVDTLDRSDRIDVTIGLNNDHVTAHGSVFSRNDGILTRLIGAGDDVTVSIDGEGPIAAWNGRLESRIGYFGEVNGGFSANFATGNEATFSFDVFPGRLIPDELTPLLGARPTLEGKVLRTDMGVRLTDLNLVTALATARGSVSVTTIPTLTIRPEINGELFSDALEQFAASPLAGAYAFNADVEAMDGSDSYAIDSQLTTALGQLTISDASFSNLGALSGRIRIQPTPSGLDAASLSALAPFSPEFTTLLTLSEDNRLSLTDLTLTTATSADEKLSVSGRGEIDLPSGRVDSTLRMLANTEMIHALSDRAIATSPIDIRVMASGTIEDLTVTATGNLPGAAADDWRIPPGHATIRLRHRGETTDGTLSVIGADRVFVLRADGIRNGNAVNVSALSLAGDAGTLTATATYDVSTQDFATEGRIDVVSPVTLPGSIVLRGEAAFLATRAAGDGMLFRVTTPFLELNNTLLSDVTAQAQGTSANLAITADAEEVAGSDWKLLNSSMRAEAKLDGDNPSVSVQSFRTALNADIEGQRIALLSPTTLTFGNGVALSSAAFSGPGNGSAEVEGSFSADRWRGTLLLSDARLPDVNAALSARIDLDTNRQEWAQISGRMVVTDPAADTRATINVAGLWTDNRLTLNASANEAEAGEVASAEITLPLAIKRTKDGLIVSADDGPLSGSLDINGPVETLAAIVPNLPIVITGPLVGRLSIAGTLLSPSVNGKMTLSGGAIEDDVVGVAVSDVNMTIDLSAIDGINTARLDMDASDAIGTQKAITASGTVRLGATEDAGIDINLKASKATLANSPELTFATDTLLNLSGPLDDMLLAGEVRIRSLDAQLPGSNGAGQKAATYTPVDVVRIDGPTGRRGPEASTSSTPLRFDVHIRNDNRVFVRGRGLTSEWTSDIHLGGRANAPILSGGIDIRDGVFRFANRNFEITEGRITFDPDNLAAPRLNLSAVYDTDEISATVQVSGTAQAPKISLTSTPSRPQEDILALVLFGKPPTQLNALESLQIANALAQLTGASLLGGNGSLTNTLRAGFGLDALSVGIDPTTGLGAIEVGKYISDEIYVSARQVPGGVGTEVSVTYEVTDHITVESTLKQNGAQNVSANYKRDY